MQKKENYHYTERYVLYPSFLKKTPATDLFQVVVIPSFNEQYILQTLTSLHNCVETNYPVEVVVVINSAVSSKSEILMQNDTTEQDVLKFAAEHNTEKLTFHSIHVKNLPDKHAGVGMARKIGMDEAARRLQTIDQPNGIIVCLDADCTVQKNYLVEIEKHFLENKVTPACSIYFEHPLEGHDFDSSIYNAILNYELFLRYYNLSLKVVGFQYPYHTIGSCMAVRSWAYQKQGGMNKRKAGEDFYFLQKIFHLGNFSELMSTTVYPSPRTSDRVPFGTGSAITKQIITNSENYTAYAFESFEMLTPFFKAVKTVALQEQSFNLYGFAEPLQEFLKHHQANEKMEEFKKNSTSARYFQQRFYYWFDGFMVLKFMHFSRDNHREDEAITVGVSKLLKRMGHALFSDKKLLLLKLRFLEREGINLPN